ncbi:hypothetical protein AGDE_07867 [Angomonas deanei]|nr:hypothetical protein AGDE_07867 [Angomonas deanei]|eukprot:EPY34532.1 hypothetical protein AGDE_07867 [Angomonas deanei]
MQCARKSSGMVVVLEGGEVLYYSMRSVKGPIEMARVLPLTAVESGGRPAEALRATCASLVSNDIAYACRVSYQGSSPSEPTFAYYRVVVGFANGRVSIVTEQGYSLGFAAHDCPVVGTSAVYNSQGEEADPNATKDSNRTVQQSSRHLGVVTCGEDGRIFLWRRRLGNMKPTVLLETTSFFCVSAFCLYQPPSVDLSLFFGTFIGKEGTPDTHLLIPHAALIHSGARGNGLYGRQLAVESETRTLAGSPVLFTSPTAMATDGNLLLVACKYNLYHVGLGPMASSTLVLKAEKPITHIVIDGPLAVVASGSNGFIHVLHLQDHGTPPVSQLGVYYSYNNRSIVNISLHATALSMVIVDSAGSVEVVRLPEAYTDAIRSTAITGSGTVMTYLQSAMSLWGRCALGDVEAAIEQKTKLEQAEKRNEKEKMDLAALRRKAEEMNTWEETVLLARMALPVGCNAYMHKEAQL